MTELRPLKKKNTLNALSGKEWIKSTKTWFVHKSRMKKEGKLNHPASFPEGLAKKFINFFSQPGDWVFDPFAGSGTTLTTSQKLGRNSVGIELYEKYVNMTKGHLLSSDVCSSLASHIIQGDSRNLDTLLSSNDYPKFDFCLTSPPYWNQLKRNTERHSEKEMLGQDSKYGDDLFDLGEINDYETFLTQQKFIFEDLYHHMRNKAYLVIVTNNVYKNGKLWPLAFDTLKTLSDIWVPKDEIIWCQDDRQLRPFGMFHSYIGNRSHHYCLVFRKEI